MTQLLMPEGEVGSTISQLTEAITAISTRIYFDTSNLPTDVPNMCTIHLGELYETVWYTVKEPTYIDVSERGFDGTTAQAWGAGANVARYVCNYDFSAIHHNVAEHETRIGDLTRLAFVEQGWVEPDTNGDLQPGLPRSWLELDANGDVQPAIEAANDPEFELDTQGNIQPMV